MKLPAIQGERKQQKSKKNIGVAFLVGMKKVLLREKN
jgi:hypothetical protein